MIIGLTGSIATGKSTVSRMLRAKGYPIIDADEISRQIVEPGSPVLISITEAFGPDVLLPDGTLNREMLGSLIFNDRENREKLNGITVIMDIPLLFESKLQSYVDKILVVSATPEIQMERLMVRNGYSADEAEIRINAQLPISEKAKGADAVINNNGTLIETEKQLDELLVDWNARI